MSTHAYCHDAEAKLRARIAELEALLRRWRDRAVGRVKADLRALIDDTDAALGKKL